MATCLDCGIALEAPTGRGRPRKYCQQHGKKHRPGRAVIARKTKRTQRKELIRRAAPILSTAGWTMQDIATLIGYRTMASLSQAGAQATMSDFSTRNTRMLEMYRSGKTLEEIGLQFGVTRERVRQIMAKTGMSRMNGGAFARKQGRDYDRVQQSIARREKVKQRRDAIALKTYGCDHATATALNDGAWLRQGGSRAAAYSNQRNSAVKRNIEWAITFSEWCHKWDESGKWPLRGRGTGHYCMARMRDAGPYAVGNVRIISNEENIAEGWDVTPPGARGMGPNEELRAMQRRVYELRQTGKGHAEIGAELGISANSSQQYCVVGKKLAQRESLAVA